MGKRQSVYGEWEKVYGKDVEIVRRKRPESVRNVKSHPNDERFKSHDPRGNNCAQIII